MSLVIYYGFLLTEEDVNRLFPNLLDNFDSLEHYTSDCEHSASYLDLKITNKLIIETITDTSNDQQIIIGVQLSRSDSQYSSALIVPEISLDATNIMNEFIKNNNQFKNTKPFAFAYMHV